MQAVWERYIYYYAKITHIKTQRIHPFCSSRPVDRKVPTSILGEKNVTPALAKLPTRGHAGHRTVRAGDLKPRRSSRGARSGVQRNEGITVRACTRGRHALAFQRRGGLAAARARAGCAVPRKGG